MRHGNFAVGPEGLCVTYHVDGEVVRTVDLPAGLYRVATFLRARLRGEDVDIPAPIFAGTARVSMNDFGDEAWQSAANPSFQVSNADRMARMLDEKLRRVEVMQARVDLSMQAMQRAAAAVPQIESRPSEVDDGSISTE